MSDASSQRLDAHHHSAIAHERFNLFACFVVWVSLSAVGWAVILCAAIWVTDVV